MNRSASTWTAAPVAAALATVGATAVLSQAPTFRLQVESVEISARVSDARGRFVRDLTSADFEVLEDGRPQPISAFTLVDLPAVPATNRPAPRSDAPDADVVTNARPFEGRLYILLLDDLHVTPARSELVRRAARRFIHDHLAPGDLMAVVSVAGFDKYSQQFTDSKARLLAAVDGFQGRAPRSSTVGTYEDYLSRSRESLLTGGLRNPYAGFSTPGDSMRMLVNVAEWFGANVRGRRKAVLFLSEGFAASREQIEEVVRAAGRADVTIHAIDPRGLTDLAADDAVELNGLTAGDDPNSAALRAITPQASRDRQRVQMTMMREVSERTNGLPLVNSNEFAGLFDRIVDENSAYYVLAYTPPNPKRDGRFHAVTVRVKRPGIVVRARRGYWAPRAAPSAPAPAFAATLSVAAREALDNPLQTSGLGLQVFAAPFKGKGESASVLIGAEVRGSDLDYGPARRAKLAFIAADVGGAVRATKVETLALDLDAESQRIAGSGVVRTMTRLELRPGRYQVRVIGEGVDSARVGSVYYDVDVPDFSKGPLTMSGVVLSSMAASRLPTLRTDDVLGSVLPGPPVGARRFPARDSLALYAEIYDNVASPHDVEIATRITSATGGVVFEAKESRRTARYLKTLNLTDLPAGAYVLTVAAQNPARPGSAVSRRIPFEVEGS